MLDLQEFLWGFSIISLLFCSLRGLRKAMHMAVSLHSPSSISWLRQRLVGFNGEISNLVSENENDISKSNTSYKDNDPEEKNKSVQYEDENLKQGSSDSMEIMGATNKLRKRPGKLVVPEYCPGLEFSKMRKKMENMEFEIQGRDYCLASKKGRKETMEDAYGVLLDTSRDPKQAFFAVVDGHGGRGAADYVADNLGKNIVNNLENIENEENPIELAIRRGYRLTDNEFLSKGVSSGACAASVVLKDGELHVANVGDCRVVLSRNGVATALTKEHRLYREDERHRIENSGGFVDCKNGVWRVQGSLAVSRAIGDMHLKEWVISEPEIHKLPLTIDCQFLIMASDGLWDKVEDQEAVDEVMRMRDEKVEACKRLLEMSFKRGNIDDVTVMLIDLHNFIPFPSTLY